MADKMTPPTKRSFIKTAFANLQAHDAVLREMENVDLQFELILSSSCFAQLKRHRITTIIAQQYNPQLGVTVPLSIKAAGEQKKFMKIMKLTENCLRTNPAKRRRWLPPMFWPTPTANGFWWNSTPVKCIIWHACAPRPRPVGYPRPDRKNAQTGKESYALNVDDGLRQGLFSRTFQKTFSAKWLDV